MTILFFTRLFYPHIGGVEKHVLEVGKRLVKQGHRVIVVTELPMTSIHVYQSKDKSAKFTDNVEGIEVYRIPITKNNWFKKFVIWNWLWKNRRLIEKADVIHCHDVFFWYFPFRFLFIKKSVFTTFHGYETQFPIFWKAIAVRKISEGLSNGNICIGEFIGKWYGATPTFVTYGGVEIRNPKSEILNKFKTQNSKIKIVFIGRLEEDTGVAIYLEILKILKKKKIDFEFKAVGDGYLRKNVEEWGKVYGFQEDVEMYIEKADIIFASSYLSILQAIAFRKLVFAVYDNPLKKDYLEMTPFEKYIVIENDEKELANKIQKYLQNSEEKQEKIDKAFNWVKNQTWDKVTGIYLRLWKIKTDV